MIKKLLPLVVVLACGTAGAATLVFDSYSVPSAFSNRSAESSPGSYIQVATTTDISNIAVFNDLAGAGNLKFVIFDASTNALLFSTATAVADDGGSATWKMSPTFSFTLTAGSSYYIGAIADVAGLWAYDETVESENGFTSVKSNPNFNSYATPFVVGNGGADGAVQLYTGGSEAVPEPGTLGLALAGLGAVALWRRRRS